MGRVFTLAVVVGITAGTVTFAVAGPDRFIHQTLVVLGFDDSQAAPTAQELIRKGIEDFRWGHYDDANRAFEDASKLSGLSEREQEILAQYRALMVRVNKSRQEATDLLQTAHRALEQGNTKQAESLATTVAANGYASDEDRDDATAIIAKLRGTSGSQAGKSIVDSSNRRQAQQFLASARQQLRQGNVEEAESLAHKAETLKVTYTRFDDSPGKVLKDIAEARGSKSRSSSSVASAANPKARAKSLVAEAQSSLMRDDFDRADELAQQAKDLNASFNFLETTPDDVLGQVSKARRRQELMASKTKRQSTPPSASGSTVTAASSETESSGESVVTASSENASPTGADSSVFVANAANTEPPMQDGPSIGSPAAETESPMEVANDDASASQDSAATAAADQAKSQVRQLLAQARKLMESGHLDETEQLLTQADSHHVNWGRFGSPVDALRRDLSDARSRGLASHSGSTANTGESAVSASTRDPRDEALAKLRQGRAHLQSGNLDEAEKLAVQAQGMKVTYRLFDDTPTQLMTEVVRVRSQVQPAASGGGENANAPHFAAEVAEIPTSKPSGSDKDVSRLAQNHLKKAREFMSHGDYESATEIARRVDAWNLQYGMFWDDTPAKVVSAAQAMRSRAIARTSRDRGQKDKAVAESLLADARKDLQTGNIDSAEQKAHQAQQLKVSYGMFSDKPENVLADISKARRGSGGSQRIPPQTAEGTSPGLEIVQSSDSSSPAAAAVVAGRSEPIRIVEPRGAESNGNPVGVASSIPMDEPPPLVLELLSEVRSVPLTPLPRQAAPGQSPQIAQQKPLGIRQSGGESDSDSSVLHAEATDPSVPQPIPLDPDQRKLEMARKLFEQGNYPRARDMALEVYTSNANLRPQAEDMVARIGVAEQSMAIQLYEAGVAATRKREYARALSFFQQVSASNVQLDPATEQQLRSYLRDLPARVGSTGATGSNAGVVTVADGSVQAPSTGDAAGQPGSDLGKRERARVEQLVTETNQKLQAARRILPSDPAQAIRDLEQAQEQVRASGLDENLAGPISRRVDAAIRYASHEKQRIELEHMQSQATDATKAQRERQLAVDRQKQEQIKQIIEKGNAFMKEGNFSDAEVIARQALAVDPDNVAAIALSYKARIEGRLQAQRELAERKEKAVIDTLHAVDLSAIPFGDDTAASVHYMPAKEWADLSKSREKRFGELERAGRSKKELEIERKLSEPVSIDFTEAPLADVVSFLQAYTGVNVVLDNHSLAVDGIRSDRPITMKLEGVALKACLKLLLGQLDLEYTVENDVLLITTPLKKQGKLYSKTYSVGDLVVPISTFSGTPAGAGGRNQGGTIGIGPNSKPGNFMNPTGQAMPSAALAQFGTGLGGSPPLTMSGSPTGSFGYGGAPAGNSSSGLATGQQVDFDALIQLIEQTISPNSWSTVGGAGTLQPFQPNLSLVVNQTQAVHEQISDLLTQLRRLQDLQVTVEVKFVSLTEDFFERIGIDFDMDIQSNQQKPLRHFGQVVVPEALNAQGGGGGGGNQVQTVTPAVLNTNYLDHEDDFAVGLNGPDRAFTPNLKIPFRTGGFGKSRPSNFVAGDGLSFGLAFLSDIEVYLFLEAAQENNRGNVLQAPKVTMFNGQTAFVFSGTIEPFVTALNPVVAAGAVAFDPQITPFFNGAFLSVTAVISADRRYVRLALVPQFTAISGEKRFLVTGGAGGGGGFGGGGGGGNQGGGAANAQAEIVVPIVATNIVLTTVSVPDGGTVMLGGFKAKTEIRNEFGTPILNKIPYLQRLFMNTGVQSVTRSLLLMVTPRIIIQEEEEELLGKTLAY